jgi:hypothetical protein
MRRSQKHKEITYKNNNIQKEEMIHKGQIQAAAD